MKNNPLKNYFYFPKSDRRALVALGCIGVFCVGVLLVVDAWTDKKRAETAHTDVVDSASIASVHKITPPISEKTLQPFDPNRVDSLTLVGFGLQPWKVRNFLHYRKAGKVFRSAEDMGRTYGWTAEDVERVAPYVRVETPRAQQFVPSDKEGRARPERRDTAVCRTSEGENTSGKFRSIVKIDANTADSATLCRIPGIGAGISRSILRYRQRLGGFCSPQQLLEVPLFSPELLAWFTVSDVPTVQPLHINKVSFQRLNSHPYISYEQTKALLRYIRLYGEVKDEAALLSTGIFTAEEWERLRPYVSFE